MRTRKFLSMLLCIVMLIQMLPAGVITVSAASIPVSTANLKSESPRTYSSGTYTLKDVRIQGAAGESAIVINGDVTLVIEGIVELIGGNGDVYKGGGAGIEVPSGSSLTLKGSGSLVVQGGKGGNGGNGAYQWHANPRVPFSSSENAGGGAGAGIGTKGATGSGVSAGTPGTITIADKNLLVQATGGAGGSSGGTGGNGGTSVMEFFDFEHWGIAAATAIDVRAGWGGQGGGGAGYPAAGIGAGGASGGNGGAGGSGAVDRAEFTFGVLFGVQPLCGNHDLSAGGGGGGGGGQGYVNGGGGGGGQSYCDTVTAKNMGSGTYIASTGSHFFSYGYGTDGIDKRRVDYERSVGHGGGSNSDGKVAIDYCSACNAKNGTGGFANGTGGSGGAGDNTESASQSGGSGKAAGAKSSGGIVNLNAGTLYAVSGGGAAMDIGSGDGTGSAAVGNLIIRGGAMTTKSNKIPTPTNGSVQVYPVNIRPTSYIDSFDARANVTVDGKEWGVTRFHPTRTDGLITIYLPNGSHTAAVADSGGANCRYPSFTVNGKELTPVPDAAGLRLDVSAGAITVVSNTQIKQGDNNIAYSGEVTLYNSSTTKNNVTINGNIGNHKITLENAVIGTLTVGSGNTATLISEGVNNSIDRIDNKASDTADIIFEGDVTSVLNVDDIYNANKPKQSYYEGSYLYISDIALGVGDSGDAAKKQLTDRGYTVLQNYDLNESAGGKYIYLGYKLTSNADNAVYDLICYNKNSFNDVASIVKRNLVPCYGGNGDLNQGAGGDDIFLFYSKKSDYDAWGTYPENPISFLYICGNSNYNTAMSKLNEKVNSVYYTKSLKMEDNSYITEDPVAELNANAGGHYIYVAISSVLPAGPIYSAGSSPSDKPITSNTHPIASRQESQRAGDITMNSYGTVNVGSIVAVKAPTGSSSSTNLDSWGTSNLTVNHGRMVFGSYITWEKRGFPIITITPPVYGSPYPNDGDPWPHYNTTAGLSNSVATARDNYYGYDRFGTVTVNGGTLQIGANGDGTFPTADADNGMSNNTVVTVKPGGNLLSGTLTDKSGSTGTKMEITGLWKNDHLQFIQRTDNTNYIGDYLSNMDVWTNGNGNMITYVTDADVCKQIVFHDSDGNAYHYIIRKNGSSYAAEKQTLPAYNVSTAQSAPLRIHPKYMVQAATLYAHAVGTPVTVGGNQNGGILLADGADTSLILGNNVSVKSIIGDGTVTLTANGHAAVSDELNVSEITFAGGAFTVPQLTGTVKILGGSVKTDAPIIGARSADGAVYRAKIPVWATDITVDGTTYPMDNAQSHGDDTTYIYIPKDSKYVTAGGKNFLVIFNEEKQEMDVYLLQDGDGKIDLTISSAEIYDNNEYFYNGGYWRNQNGNKFEVIGTSDVHTLTVTGSDPVITMTNVNVSGTPVEIASGVKAELILVGTNTLTGDDDIPAIHVPEGAELKISGNGILNAAGGINAPAIGGKANEVNGKITLAGGTLNLNGGYNTAVGAGTGAETPAGSIVITGGTIKTNDAVYSGDSFGTTPVNAQGQALARIIFRPDSAESIKVDGVDYYANAANDDGRVYLYVVSGNHTVTAGGKDYLVAALNIAETQNGTIKLYLIDAGSEISLNSGDMVVEGSDIRVSTKPDEGYGLVSGPSSGYYKLVRDGSSLMLKAERGWSSILLDDWDAASESFSKSVSSDTTVEMGVAHSGNASVAFTASGTGIIAEILVNGRVVKTAVLTGELQTITYDWISSGNEAVALRFSGNGTVSLTSAILTETANCAQIKAVFAQTVTLTVQQQPADAQGIHGVIHAYGEDGTVLKDLNPSQDGIQVFAGTKAKIVYTDPDGGDVFEYFMLDTGSGTPTQETASDYTLTMTQDVTVSAKTYWAEYAIVVAAPSFDSITYGNAYPAAKDIVITDSGNTPATIASVTLSGTNADSFELTTGTGLTGNTIKPKDNLNAGTYTAVITVTYNGGATAEANVSFTVNKQSVDVPEIGSKAYTGGLLKADVSDTAIYTVTENDGGTNAGKYDVVLTLNDAANYKWSNSNDASVTLEFEITKSDSQIETAVINAVYGDKIKLEAVVGVKDAALLSMTPAQDQVAFYCGDVELGVVNVVNGAAVLEYDTSDRKLTIGDNVITVYYGGSVNLNGTSSDSITVKLSAKDVDVEITPNGGVYGEPITPASVTLDESALVGSDTLNVILTYTGTANDETPVDGVTAPTLAGSYTVTASANDEYYNLVGTLSKAFTVAKAEVVVPVITSKIYTGDTLTADVSDTTLYTVTKNDGGIDVGKYDVVLTLNDAANYKWTDSDDAEITLEFEITKADSAITPSGDMEATYGDTITLTAVVGRAVANTSLLAELPAQDQVAFYCGDIELGKADVVYADEHDDYGTATLLYNTADRNLILGENIITAYYGGSINLNGTNGRTVTVTMKPKDITVAITANGGVYEGSIVPATVEPLDYVSDYKPDVTLTYTGTSNSGTLIDSTDAPILAGSYTVTASVSDKYYNLTGIVDAEFVVAKAEVTPPQITSKAYTGNPQIADVGDTLLYTVTQNHGGINVGGYDVVLTLRDPHNYTWPNSNSAEITLKFDIIKGESQIQNAVIDAVYGDAIMLEAVVGVRNAALFTMTPAQDQVAFYCGDTLLGIANVENGTAVFVYDTSDRELQIGENVITVYYGGSVNLNGTQSDSITVNLIPKDITVDIMEGGGTEDKTIIPATAEPVGYVEGYKPYVLLIYTDARGNIVSQGECPQDAGDYTVTAVVKDVYYRLTGETTASFVVEENYDYWLAILMMLYNQEFDITAATTEGGTITPAGVTKVKYSRDQLYTITPADGYMIADVLVDGESIGAVEVYNFDNVKKDHTITVIFSEIPWQNPFMDIGETDVYYDDVKYVYENGLMIGTGTDIFSPDATLTRAMLVTILWRVAGQPIAESPVDFFDVPADQWYSEAIAWASANGIVLGYGNGTFGTNDPITREQLATILYRYEQHLGGGFKGLWMYHMDYADLADVSDWAYEAVAWMNMKNIYVIREEKQLDPKEEATRAETAAFLRRFCEYRKEQEDQ